MVNARISRSQATRTIAAGAVSAVALLSAAACGTQTQAAPTALGTGHSSTTSSPTAGARSSAPAATKSSSEPTTGTSASALPATTKAAAPTTASSSAASTTSSAGNGCASAKGFLAGSSITICPAAAPVGAVVHITIKNCTTVDPAAGLPEMAAASLSFLGPNSWLGTNGGGGANVPFSPRTGSTQATAAFTIPATYTGGNENGGAYPTLKTKPGTNYTFTTDPAGECTIHFTVTGS
jgi:hypothetical protein